jgi:hypothetical protein
MGGGGWLSWPAEERGNEVWREDGSGSVWGRGKATPVTRPTALPTLFFPRWNTAAYGVFLLSREAGRGYHPPTAASEPVVVVGRRSSCTSSQAAAFGLAMEKMAGEKRFAFPHFFG